MSLSLNMSLKAMMCMPTTAAENINLQAQEWTKSFLALPDRNNYIAAYGLGYGLSLGSFKIGNKYLPVMGTVRIGKMNIPVKTLCNVTGGYIISYTPLASYVYSKKTVNPANE